MNLHEKLDMFLNQTPRKILLETVIMLVLVIGLGVLIFWLGTRQERDFADSEYLQNRAETMQKVADLEADARLHETRETQLKAQNEILKKQNEAAAETFRKFDNALRGDGKKLEELTKARNTKIEEINADDDYLNQVRGICRDYRENGFGELSFCHRFEEKK